MTFVFSIENLRLFFCPDLACLAGSVCDHMVSGGPGFELRCVGSR